MNNVLLFNLKYYKESIRSIARSEHNKKDGWKEGYYGQRTRSGMEKRAAKNRWGAKAWLSVHR